MAIGITLGLLLIGLRLFIGRRPIGRRLAFGVMAIGIVSPIVSPALSSFHYGELKLLAYLLFVSPVFLGIVALLLFSQNPKPQRGFDVIPVARGGSDAV